MRMFYNDCIEFHDLSDEQMEVLMKFYKVLFKKNMVVTYRKDGNNIEIQFNGALVMEDD